MENGKGMGENGRGRMERGFRLLEPLGYLDFLALMKNAALVLTGSGGIQEETTYFGVPFDNPSTSSGQGSGQALPDGAAQHRTPCDDHARH